VELVLLPYSGSAKILPISVRSQEQSSNLCQMCDDLIKTSFLFYNIIFSLHACAEKDEFLTDK